MEILTDKELLNYCAGSDLSCKDLSGNNLSERYFRGVNFYNSNLNDANLKRAILISANFAQASLRGADLSGANLSYANFAGADLSNANLSGANLYCANFTNARLEAANMTKAFALGASFYAANIRHTIFDETCVPSVCPPEGSFIGWKVVVSEEYSPIYQYPRLYPDKNIDIFIVKLKIPENAKRSSATSRKCRAEFADVVEIYNRYTNEKVEAVTNYRYNIPTRYEVGKRVRPDRWDDCRWNECSNGIHFFMSKEEAENYIYL